MLQENDYSSDSDESDEDYNPVGNESDPPSELDSDENEIESKSSKRKNGDTLVTSKKIKKRRISESLPSKNSPENVKHSDEGESNKEREDALWADFFSSTSDNLTSTSKKSESIAQVTTSKPQNKKTDAKSPENVSDKNSISDLFEFAGEIIAVENATKTPADGEAKTVNANANPDKESIGGKSTGIPNRVKIGSAGISAVLGQMQKKNKLSVLEKTKLDWSGFKAKEGINEELQTHNKGRDGFLERRDFLERTDFKRFEIEKSLRQVTRKK